MKIFFVFLLTGHSPPANFYGFYNEIRHGYEVSRFLEKDAMILAADGTWKVSREDDKTLLSTYALTAAGKKSKNPNKEKTPSYPPILAPARTLSDLKKSLLQLKDQDQLVLYVVGHGEDPNDPNRPETARLNLWGHEITWEDLGSVLKQLPASISIKISSVNCYGGAVHALARQLPNVCSSSFIPFFSEGFRKYSSSYYGDAFWKKYLEKKGQASFGELALEGIVNDYSNAAAGNLSSFDYIDFVLGKGPYTYKFKNEPGRSRWVKDSEGYMIMQKSLPPDFEPQFSFSPLLSFATVLSSLEIENELSDLVQTDIEKLPALQASLKKIGLQDSHWHEILRQFEKKSEGFLKAAQAFDAEKNSGSVLVDLREYYQFHLILDGFSSLEEFEKTANEEQKKKLLDLIHCEWSPL